MTIAIEPQIERPGRPWLVTGAAGYIGSHVVRELHRRDVATISLDDLSTGRAGRLAGPAVIGSVQDGPLLEQLLGRHQVRGVIHLAGNKSVAESFTDPARYYDNNVSALACLLRSMLATGVDRLVFSSSAAVYGPTGAGAVGEDHPTAPLSPYGRSKLIGEQMLTDHASAYGLRFVALRYFNAAGTESSMLAETGAPNLIPQVVQAVERSHRPVIYGVGHDTPDRTCVRDFIDVRDLASAHAEVMGLLAVEGPGQIFNVGTGQGHSVREVVSKTLERMASDLEPIIRAARPGDPASVIACISRLTAATTWRPTRTLDDMIDSVIPAQRRAS